MAVAVKICGNNSLANSLEVAKLKPSMMGFIFYEPSKRFATLKEIEKIMKEIKHVQTIGVFVNEKMNVILDTAEKLNLAGIQLHGNESTDICSQLREKAFVIKALNGNAENLQELINKYENCVDYYLLDNMDENYGGSGKHFELNNLQNIRFPHPFMLAGGIGPDDANMINKLKLNKMFYGVDLNSRFELSPGIKDINRLQNFIRSIQ